MPVRALVTKLAAMPRPNTGNAAKYSATQSVVLASVAGIPIYPTGQPIESIVSGVPISGAYADILAYANMHNFPTFRMSYNPPEATVIVVTGCLIIGPFPIPMLLAFLFLPLPATGSQLILRMMINAPVPGVMLQPVPGATGPLALVTTHPAATLVDALIPFSPPRATPPNPYVVQVTTGRIPWFNVDDGLELPDIAVAI